MNALDRIIAQRDEKEYQKVKSRMMIAAKIADAIKERGITQKQLAGMLGKKPSEISRLLTGNHNFSHDTLFEIQQAVGVKLLWNGCLSIRDFMDGKLPEQPGQVALWAAVVSIVTKELLYRYTVRVGRKVGSPSVVANAWHHRSDALSSVGTLLGIGCAYFFGGVWRLADPAAAIIVAGLILFIAGQLAKTGLDELLEKSLPHDEEARILKMITADPAVSSPHNLRTRRIGQNISIEAHIRVEGTMTVADSHRLTEEIERRLRNAYGEGTMVSIHVEPKR